MKIAILAGDGIGPEIVAQAVRVLEALRKDGLKIELEPALLGAHEQRRRHRRDGDRGRGEPWPEGRGDGLGRQRREPRLRAEAGLPMLVVSRLASAVVIVCATCTSVAMSGGAARA